MAKNKEEYQIARITIKRMKRLGGCFVFEKTIFDEKLGGKCLEVSGILCKFAEKKNN